MQSLEGNTKHVQYFFWVECWLFTHRTVVNWVLSLCVLARENKASLIQGKQVQFVMYNFNSKAKNT